MKTTIFTHRIKGLAFITAAFLLLSACDLAEDLLSEKTISDLEGEWNCDEDSEFFKKALDPVYVVTISQDPENPDGIAIDNFYNLGGTVYATLSGLTLTLIPQTMPEGNQLLSGSGIISSNYKTITWAYEVNIGGSAVDHVTAIYTKK